MIATFYTALVFGYTLHGERITTAMWFASEQQCFTAMDHLETLYNYIADNVSGKEIYMWCDKSDVASSVAIDQSVRPKARPEGVF